MGLFMPIVLGILVLPFLSVGAPAQAPLRPETASRNWMVRDVLEASSLSSAGRPMSWRMGYPLGDPGGDGQWDFIAFASDPWGGADLLSAFSTGHGGIPEVQTTLPLITRFEWGNAALPTIAPIRAGVTQELAVIAPMSQEVHFLDPVSHALLDILFLPPPAPGFPPLDWFASIANVGDLEGDGYEELRFTGTALTRFVVGLIDGATHGVRWQYWGDVEEWPTILHWIGPNGPADLNGDGIGDVLISYTTYKWQTGLPMENQQIALSGADGVPIWVHSFRQSSWRRPGVVSPDVTGDGLPEVFSLPLALTESVALLDGGTGQPIWEVPETELEPLLPGGRIWTLFQYPVLFVPSLDPSLPYELVVSVEFQLRPRENHRGLVHLSPVDGRPLAWEEFGGDLQPWSSDPLNAPNLAGQGTWLMGDGDGDGFPELAHLVPDLALSGPRWVFRMVVLGQQTLFGPER
ncbi:MAG: hypothetical protein D6819_05725, partial [Gammaproteobacteria bacterium]